MKNKKRAIFERLLIVAVAVSVVLIIFAALWSRDAKKPDISDLTLDTKFVPYDENAFTYFCNATNFLHRGDDNKLRDFISEKEYNLSDIEQILERHSQAISEIHKGLEKDICLAPSIQSFSDTLPYLSDFRKFAFIFQADSRFKRLNGKIGEAIDSALAIVRLGYLVQKDSETLINFLVGNAIIEIGLKEIRNISDDSSTSIENLNRMLSLLEPYSNVNEGFISSMKGEFKVVKLGLDALENGDLQLLGTQFQPGSFPAGESFARMLLKRNKTIELFAENTRNIIRSLEKPFSEFKVYEPLAKLVSQPTDISTFVNPNFLGNFFLRSLAEPYGNVLKNTHRLNFSISSTKLLLTLKIFRTKEGRLPNDLKDLVSEYLKAVPLDPYDGKPVRYSNEKKLFYSIGANLKDETQNPEDSSKKKSMDDIVIQIK